MNPVSSFDALASWVLESAWLGLGAPSSAVWELYGSHPAPVAPAHRRKRVAHESLGVTDVCTCTEKMCGVVCVIFTQWAESKSE